MLKLLWLLASVVTIADTPLKLIAKAAGTIDDPAEFTIVAKAGIADVGGAVRIVTNGGYILRYIVQNASKNDTVIFTAFIKTTADHIATIVTDENVVVVLQTPGHLGIEAFVRYATHHVGDVGKNNDAERIATQAAANADFASNAAAQDAATIESTAAQNIATADRGTASD